MRELVTADCDFILPNKQLFYETDFIIWLFSVRKVNIMSNGQTIIGHECVQNSNCLKFMHYFNIVNSCSLCVGPIVNHIGTILVKFALF